jgi:hypothetical protein
MDNNHEVDHEREDAIIIKTLYKNIGLAMQEETKQTSPQPFFTGKEGLNHI